MAFAHGSIVRHQAHGRGSVVADQGSSVVVRFDSGRYEGCSPAELTLVLASESALPAPGAPAAVLARAQAAAIRSTNDAWGVFSASRIDLLPHQLWVARKAHARRPIRLLVADDVGLGKTIEAGLILLPLLASGEIRRLLILCPASLVEQWQERLRKMFDIRVQTYSPEQDTDRRDFWGSASQVVASAQTMRMDRNGRWGRLLQAPPWDMVLVDEAHHAHATDAGRTLTYQLLEQLQEARLMRSLVLFTGTPHRGKDHGFLALLRLLDPRVDPKAPVEDQLDLVSNLVVRNNKSRVTDMSGKPLFPKTTVTTHPYDYSPEEAHFYELMTRYIAEGRAYASGLDVGLRQTANLVLVAMQKLAASSVAAVRRALQGRLGRLRQAKRDVSALRERVLRAGELAEVSDAHAGDALAELEEAAAADPSFLFGPEEESSLLELLAAADAVRDETKIRRLLDDVVGPLGGESVLFFTEYKATQALLVSALKQRFGDDSVTFINGDGQLDQVVGSDGRVVTLQSSRESAAFAFNRGDVRYLVSTEAAGEGIDLHGNCRQLVHVDIPWNPMRMHQRVGRLSRYGQTRAVEVAIITNPGTVEGRIWQCLSEKLDRINRAFAGSEDPEDMLQLVLGQAPSGAFEQLYVQAARVPHERFSDWFRAEAATFGGESAVAFVRKVFGSVSRFDFGSAAAELPKVDLPDLAPFLKLSLALEQRRWEESDSQLSFKTPEHWLEDHRMNDRYELTFDRKRAADRRGPHLAGVGHVLIDRALRAATARDDLLAVLPGLAFPLVLFLAQDEVTTGPGPKAAVLVGLSRVGERWELLRDWEVVLRLNALAAKPLSLTKGDTGTATGSEEIPIAVDAARAVLPSLAAGLGLGFGSPRFELFAVLWPGAGRERELRQQDG